MTIEIERKERGRYQHGNLRAALLAAAEKILVEQGIQTLTLRAAARAVGVSHTAPQNHFGDLTGLLSELAALGYRRLGEALLAAGREGGDDVRERNLAIGRAYVRFARENSGMYVLMFRGECLDTSRPNLLEALKVLRSGMHQTTWPSQTPLTPLQLLGAGVARWSLVHGFAMLLIEGRLDGVMRTLPGGADVETLLEVALSSVQVNDKVAVAPPGEGKPQGS